MIKAVLFDFDGVLTIEKTGSAAITKYIAKRCGLPAEQVRSCYQMCIRDRGFGEDQHTAVFGGEGFDIDPVSYTHLYITGRMVRPIRQMVAATESFSKGDFSARVPVGDFDELGKLAMAFNNMASSMTTMESTRRSFIANVSHELKTPMTTIGGFIDGILDGTIPPDRERHYLEIVSAEVKRLSRLVRSMLDVAKIEAGEMKIELAPVDINDVILRLSLIHISLH